MPKQLQVGIKGVITNNDKALILRCKSNFGPTEEYWDLPGGRIDDKETIEETLHRELKEEILNLKKYKIGKLLYVFRMPYDFSDGTGLVLVYYQIQAKLKHIELSDEHSEFRWVSSHELVLLEENTGVELPQGNKEALRLALEA